MGKIAVMPDALASQVAAGEVVERPAAVVRELLDNALDAGARNIEIQIAKGGAALIRVTDDGAGMSRDDAVMCIERHATSKIREFADLSRVVTFGFRGEALPSIASVSLFKLRSREHGALTGTCVEIDGGRLVEVRDDGGAPGTVVEVRSLFVNVPARRKFLKTENTEFGHIDQQVRLHAIAHPGVGFKLVRDGRVALSLPPTKQTRERVRGLIGDEVAESLLDMSASDRDGVTLSGLVSRAGTGRPNRRMQWVFLNGRPIESPAMFRAIKEAYRGRMPREEHPMAFLFLEMEPEAFDINVHPAKKEVRFRRSGVVERVVHDALIERLTASPKSTPKETTFPTITPNDDAEDLVVDGPQAENQQTGSKAESAETFRPKLRLAVESLEPKNKQGELMDLREPEVGSDTGDDEVSEEQEIEVGTGIPEDFKYRGMLDGAYILFETDDGLALLNVRAARERIIYEKLAAHEGATEPAAAQRLLLPVSIETEQEEYEAISEVLGDLQSMGLEIDEFGARTFKVSALPAGVKQIHAADVIREVFAAVGNVRRGEKSSARSDRRTKLMVGVSRVMAKSEVENAVLKDENAAIRLTESLFLCGMPYCCPKGKPTLVHLGYPELSRRFGR